MPLESQSPSVKTPGAMPAKKTKKSSSPQLVAGKSRSKAPQQPSQKPSQKPSGKKGSAAEAKPAPKSAKVSPLTGGFVRLSETHIQKVYR
jgi:hypothetical protein